MFNKSTRKQISVAEL